MKMSLSHFTLLCLICFLGAVATDESSSWKDIVSAWKTEDDTVLGIIRGEISRGQGLNRITSNPLNCEVYLLQALEHDVHRKYSDALEAIASASSLCPNDETIQNVRLSLLHAADATSPDAVDDAKTTAQRLHNCNACESIYRAAGRDPGELGHHGSLSREGAYVTVVERDADVDFAINLLCSIRLSGSDRRAIAIVSSQTKGGAVTRLGDAGYEVRAKDAAEGLILEVFALYDLPRGVFLNARALVLENIEELFHAHGSFAAVWREPTPSVNADVFVFVPSEVDFRAMRDRLVTKRYSLDYGRTAEEAVLSLHFGFASLNAGLPLRYNTPAHSTLDITHEVSVISYTDRFQPWDGPSTHTYRRVQRTVGATWIKMNKKCGQDPIHDLSEYLEEVQRNTEAVKWKHEAPSCSFSSGESATCTSFGNTDEHSASTSTSQSPHMEGGDYSPPIVPMEDYGIGEDLTEREAEVLRDALVQASGRVPKDGSHVAEAVGKGRNRGSGQEVTFVAVNSGASDFLYNWYCHAHRVRLSNFFIFALDEEITKIVDGHLPYVYFPKDEFVGGVTNDIESTQFKSPKFNRIVNARLYALRHVLSAGYDVLLSDVDIVFTKDPRLHFGRDVDYEFQPDLKRLKVSDLMHPPPFDLSEKEPNGGFFRLASNNRTIAFVDDILRESMKPTFTNQQRDIANVLRRWVAEGKAVQVHDNPASGASPDDVMTFRALDPLMFPSGDTFYWRNEALNQAIQAFPERKPVMLHATFFFGAEKKREVLSAIGRWIAPEKEEIPETRFVCPAGY